MSHQNPHVESPTPPHPDSAIQPTAPDFVETPDCAPLSHAPEPLPIWLYLICGAALFLTGSSFTGFQIFGRDMLDQGAGGPIAQASSAPEAPPSPADLGKKLYSQNCASCHQASGEGSPGSYPPLANSEWVTGSKKRLAAILLAGLSGPLTVKGGNFGTQVMPAQAGNFTDEKLAAIMTYLRSAWGNTAGPVTPEEVTAAKAAFGAHLGSPYNQAELLGIAPNGPDPTDKKP